MTFEVTSAVQKPLHCVLGKKRLIECLAKSDSTSAWQKVINRHYGSATPLKLPNRLSLNGTPSPSA
jgi:hypothetical protein